MTTDLVTKMKECHQETKAMIDKINIASKDQSLARRDHFNKGASLIDKTPERLIVGHLLRDHRNLLSHPHQLLKRRKLN